MTTLTLRGKPGEIVLFAPREVEGGLSAHALMALAPTKRPHIFRDDNKRKYRVPPIPSRGLFLAHVVLKEVQ